MEAAAVPAKVRPGWASKPRVGSLAEEAKLVRAIKASVRRDPARALSLVTEHGLRFAGGVLVHEAGALRVQAACALGRVAEAERIATSLPAGHAWASGCPAEEKPTSPAPSGEEGGI